MVVLNQRVVALVLWVPLVASRLSPKHADLPPRIFAPGGRLVSVEMASQAGLLDDPRNNLVAAVQCREGVVVVATVPESPYLPKNVNGDIRETASTSASSFTPLLLPETGIPRPPFLRLSNDMWAVTAGNQIDSQLLRLKLHRIAEQLREEDRGDRPDVLARRLADNQQILTQEEGHGRILAAFAVVFTSKEIWRIDPHGQFWKCRGTVVGRDCVTAESKLLSKVENENSGMSIRGRIAAMSKDEAIELCKDSMTETLAQITQTKLSDKSTSTELKGLWVSNKRDSPMWFSNIELKGFGLKARSR